MEESDYYKEAREAKEYIKENWPEWKKDYRLTKFSKGKEIFEDEIQKWPGE